MESPFLTSRDRVCLVVFTLAVCLPACWMQDVTLNETLLLESASPNADRASELLVRQPLLWLVDGIRLALFFLEPVFVIRMLLVVAMLATVLSTAALATEWYGRRIGLMAGGITATLFGVSAQVWQSDVSIVLALLPIWMFRLFARLEPQTGLRIQCKRLKLVGDRRALVAFAFVFALTILSIDHQVLLLSILVPLLLACPIRFRPVTWSLVFVVVAAGPIVLSLLNGNSADQLFIQGWVQISAFSGRNELSVAKLASFAGIWLPMFLIGLWATRHESLGAKNSRERLLWSWALIPPVTCALHSSMMHSLVVVTGAWSVIAALGISYVSNVLALRIPSVRHERQRVARIGFAAAGVLCVYSGIRESTGRADHIDAAFFAQVRDRVDERSQLLIDPTIDLPRHAFAEYHLSNKSALHLATAEASGQLFVVAVEDAQDRLSGLGRVDVVMQSDAEHNDGGRLTLFRIGPPAIATADQADAAPPNRY